MRAAEERREAKRVECGRRENGNCSLRPWMKRAQSQLRAEVEVQRSLINVPLLPEALLRPLAGEISKPSSANERRDQSGIHRPLVVFRLVVAQCEAFCICSHRL